MQPVPLDSAYAFAGMNIESGRKDDRNPYRIFTEYEWDPRAGKLTFLN